MSELPKVLIISRGVWDDAGTSSTLSNIFENYDSNKLSQIYIETKKPNTNHCSSFFQISEFSLIKKMYKWKVKTGHRIDSVFVQDETVARKEAVTMQYVRGHRSFLYTVLREFLWHLNGWKSKELKEYIREENPDLIWLTGSPLILMNRLSQYVVKEAKKPYCLYEMDDVYSYKNCGSNPLKYIYRFFLRKRVKSLIKGASQVFVISPKMKKEFDNIFGIDSCVLTKGIDFSERRFVPYMPKDPIKMVYMGQLIYDRISSIEMLAKALDVINGEKNRILLNIYTGTQIPESIKDSITKNGSVCFCAPVPYSQVEGIVNQSDVVLFAESFNPKFKNIARLSFSTKLTDYFAGGKCLFAIGPDDIAPIEYLKEKDAAIVVSNREELVDKLECLVSPEVILEYAEKSYRCGEQNHNKHNIDEMFFSKLIEITTKNESSTIS
jgi:hypothetical protein